MHSVKVYIYNPYEGYFAIGRTINNFHTAFVRNGIECEVVSSLDGVPKDAIVIPYATEPAVEAVKKGYKPDYVYLADAYTLGYINKLKFYLKRLDIFNYDFLYTIHAFLQDFRIERKVARSYKNIIFVSETDADYFKIKYGDGFNTMCIKAGIDNCVVAPKTASDSLRLGILATWDHPSITYENGWFIKDYFAKFTKEHPDIKLYLAGRGKYISNYKSVKNVEIIGEVVDLDDFFKNIDVFIAVNPKGCGILNRVLDAFTHKTCVLGFKPSFSGFRYMENSFLEFDSYRSFVEQMEYILQNPQIKEKMVQNASLNIQKYNNWEANNDEFVRNYFVGPSK